MSVALALLGSGLAASAASIYNNIQNLKNQQTLNDTSVELANTQHQREVKDLISAGLNPVLSTSGSGSAVPTLKNYETDNPLSGLSNAVASAAQYGQQFTNDLKQQKLDIEATELANSAQAIENGVARDEAEARRSIAAAQRQAADVERMKSFIEELGVRKGAYRYIDGSDNAVRVDLPDPDTVDLVREGYISGLKMKANENFRANTKTAFDVLNGAGSLYRASPAKGRVPVMRKGGKP